MEHGAVQYEYSDLDLSVEGNIQTVGDYLELLLQNGAWRLPISASIEIGSLGDTVV